MTALKQKIWVPFRWKGYRKSSGQILSALGHIFVYCPIYEQNRQNPSAFRWIAPLS